VGIKYSKDANNNIVATPTSNTLTQSQVDAEAIYAAASNIDPFQAALIKKNAQGNLMSPGVLQALSALNVNAQSGVAQSIANIDAATQQNRLANQMKLGQERAAQEFDNSGRGIFWRGVKGVVKGATTFLGTTFQSFNAAYRTGSMSAIQSAQNYAATAAGFPVINKEYIPSIAEQTTSGQVIIKSLSDIKKGKFPDIDTGKGFFPSEETGVGHAAREASLTAAKKPVRNSKGEVIGYMPRTILGDTYSNIFTLGHPETRAGQTISLVADIAGSFVFDPGITRAKDLKQLRKLAQQERVKGAMDVAANLEAQAAKLEEAQNRAIEASRAIQKQADNVKKIKIDEARQTIDEAKSTRLGKNEAAIKASTSVRIAENRLNETLAIENKYKDEVDQLKISIKELSDRAKAPNVVARTESAITRQTKQLDQMKADRDEALNLGRISMVSLDDIAAVEKSIQAAQSKLDNAKGLVESGDLPSVDAITSAKEALVNAQRRYKDVASARVAAEKQVAERTRTAKLAARAREIGAQDTLKAVKAERTLSEKLSDATLSLKDKRTAWGIAVREISNLDQTYQRPEFAYDAIANFLTSGHGTVAVDRLVEMTDWKEIWRKSGGRLDHKIAQALADAKNPDDVVDIIAPYLKRGDIQEGVLKPGILSQMGESITKRTAFAMPTVKNLVGVGARVQSRLMEHQKVAALFDGFYNGIKSNVDLVAKPLKGKYSTKIKGGVIINIHDREELLRSAEDFGVAAKLPRQMLDEIIDEISGAASNSVAGYAASVKLLKAVFAHNATKVPPHMQDAFKKYTTAFEQSAEQMSSYWARQHIAGAELKYINLKGESVILPGPHMSSELLNSTIYIPPVGELLKLTSKLSKYKTLAKGTELADIAIGGFWKKLQLVRPAYIIRNIAEEQIRVFGTGHISFFNNPGMALAMWLGRQDGPVVRRILNQFDTYRNTVFDESFSTGDDALDVLDETIGHTMKNSYVDIMGADRLGSFDDRAVKILQFKNVGAVAYGHPRFFDGVANALRMLNSDEMARVVAGHNPPEVTKAIAEGAFRQDAVVDYFLTGPGRKVLDNFAASTPDNFSAFLKTPDGLKKYLFTAKEADTGKDISMLARVTEATGGNKTLMQLVAKGTTSVAGKTINIPRVTDSAVNSISNSKQIRAGKKALLDLQEEFAKELKFTFSKAGNWDGALMNVPSRNLVHVEGKADKRTFVDWFFDKATEFEKNSTFGPEFRQAYWDAINQIAKSLDSNAKAALEKTANNSLTTLQKAGVQVGDKHPVWNAFRASQGDGPLTLEEAHAYADTFARNKVKGLFYNAQEKRLIFHQLRLIAPFASAWENTIRKWSEIAIENPMQVYKGVKILDWAQNPESSAIYQLTDAQDVYDPNQGFFFTDPNSGQRQFWVPFAGTVMSKLAGFATGANYSGAPMAFSANPASFNFALGAGSILPGIGPGVTLPLSVIGTFNNNFIDNLPLGIQKWLFPFGRADFSSGLQSAILPGNWNKIIGGLAGLENTYASNFKPVMSYLAAGGNYNLDDPIDQERLVNDADSFSRWQSIMRGLTGLVSPVGLIQQGLGKDENGDVTTQIALFNDFEQIRIDNDGDYNKSWFDFLNLYGPSQAFALISSSSGNGPSNWDSYQFVVQNPDVASKYKDVWGYVMPGGGLSTEMYNWNLIHDTKKRLSAKEILEKVNGQRYYAARDALMTKVDSTELNKDQYREALTYLKDSMGGGPVVEFDPNKRGRLIIQLKSLIEDQRFTDIPSVTALRDYMYLRDTALQQLGKKSFTGAANEQYIRDWLAAQAEWVIQDNPDFQKMFYAFFANELEGK